MNETGTRVLEPKEQVGLVVVLTGNGKGKTTSALGMALRTVGHGMKVCLIHFIKGYLYAGEMDGLKRLAPEAEAYFTGKGYCGLGDNPYSKEEHRVRAQEAMNLAFEKMASDSFHLIVLDEINNAVRLKLVELNQVLELIDTRPPHLHLVLTGRDAHPDVIERAHIVTEMREIKHSLHQSIEPQKGIDY
ncbi:MAG: cob(I)yrinic acid a,c-diamide adenosyltransferase [bacterium]